MKPVQHELLSEADYLERERRSDVKHEFINGQMVAMAGGNARHSLIIANVSGAIRQLLLGRPCFVFNSDLRVNVSATRLYTYPDVTVTCGPAELHPDDGSTLRNPTLIVEVLSESTEAYDRGAKFAHYRNLPSLQEYVLVWQEEHRVERYVRVEAGGWLLTEWNGDALMPLAAIGITLPLAEIYDKVELLAGTTSS